MAGEGLIEAYVALVVGGAGFGDEGLVRLRAVMSAAEIEVVRQRLCAAYIRALLPPVPPEGPQGIGSSVPVPDFVDLYVALVQRGARPDEPWLVMLADGMTGEELARCKAALGEEWLRGEALPARPN